LDDFSEQILLLYQNRTQLLDRLHRTSTASSSSFNGQHRDLHFNQQQQQQQQQQGHGGVIMMDPKYHRDFVDLFYQIQDEIPKIDGYLKALHSWNEEDSYLMRPPSGPSSSSAPQATSTIDRLVSSLDAFFFVCVHMNDRLTMFNFIFMGYS